MHCQKCGKENTSDAKFCQSCGTKLESGENLRENEFGLKKCPNCKNGIPKEALTCNFCGKSALAVETELASIGSRIGAYLIDTLIIIVLSIIFIALLVPIDSIYDPSTELSYNLIVLTLMFSYFILLEGPLGKGRTIGKRVLKLRVVKEEDKSVIGYGASFGRNILRVIDGFLFYIIGMILIYGSDLNQRLGDKAVHTIVIKE